MELKECITCGSHSFTDNKCDYCGNEYEVKEPTWEEILEKQEQGYVYCDNEDEITFPEPDFQETPEGKTLLKIMIWVLVSIIWFAVTVFIPPLFLITIIGLIIWVCRKVCKKY